MKKILILSANPINTDRLRLDEEVREIEESWERSKYRSQFEVFTKWAVRIDDLRQALLDKEPQIVHFSGHGMRTGGVGLDNNRDTLPLREAVRLNSQPSGIALEDDFGRMQLVSTEALTDLFELFKDKVECVLLNACYSETQAKAIHQHIDCVIGMTQSIPDRTAINFSTAFYQAIFAGRNYEDAFKFGSNNIDLHNSSEFYPKFHNRPNYKTLSFHNQTNNQPSNLLDQPTSNTATPATQEDYKQRKVLLNKVKNYWIEGVLEKSLHTRVMIELGMEERLDAVEHLGIEELEPSRQALPKGTGVTDIFSQMGEGRTLLILGEPGSGKTTTLLTLTKHLIISTEQDLSRQIPVVFNLSSWANKQQKIAEWLVQQLYEEYHVPKAKGKAWVENEQLLLLLDGLDEVKAERREACVQALNQFIRDHGLTEMVVTSRIGDYTALRASLTLQKAICIQSLTPEQINQYLDRADEQLKALKTLLEQDTALQELAKSPLTLGIMTLAYEGVSIEDLPNTNSTEERRKHLFNAYIERMLNRRITVRHYSTSRTIRWLTWLAQRMLQHSQTIFLIEQIQPTWLQTKLAKRIYNLGFNLFICLLLLPIFALMPSLIFSLMRSVTPQYILIIFIGLLLWSFFKPSQQEIKPVETLKWEWRNFRAYTQRSASDYLLR
ncbi:NACHT domain-containing protein [Iningainema tapete]|uniref:NACHT domain-containing protein n=1 Tax=Iningainema tapete BLCC-T55 TaxID=2748662 RepID=A0A8J6XIR0_9CYAN|nr:NACHT domain-containing protein [Iningainema tapete]MBD2777590.1 NACHT domain-containing protein [Iningainema tapete BLCC-T55]